MSQSPQFAKKSDVKPWVWSVPIVSILGLLALLLVLNSGSANKSDDLLEGPAPGPAPEGMAWIPGGTFVMGTEHTPDQDAPLHSVSIRGFWMDITEVTNKQYAEFVKATGYVTVSERQPTQAQYPTARPELLVPGSAIFVAKACPGDPLHCSPEWWEFKKGADWKHPEGPESTIAGKENHPVVHLTWSDAKAYCDWAGKRLPTEAEWERAARGGLDQKEFVWGDQPQGTGGKYFANTYQGTFPQTNAAEDGFAGSSPVGSYPPNGYGLYDMSGNAWEWCSDWYAKNYYLVSPKKNPQGPSIGDPDDQHGQPQRVRRGGSFLCADSYCRRYLPGCRDKNPSDSSAMHTGFRCVKSPE